MAEVKELRFHPDALDEADAALEWYVVRSRAAAENFMQELELAARRVLDAPTRWPRIDTLVRRYLLPTYPFSLIYRVGDDFVEVIAVAHQRRKPGYWRSRT